MQDALQNHLSKIIISNKILLQLTIFAGKHDFIYEH